MDQDYPDNGLGDFPDLPDLPDLPQEPKRRANYVTPKKRKRTFNDGAQRPSPATVLRKIINIVGKDAYKHAPLLPGQDIRVLVVSKGKGNDPIVCWLLPTTLPGTRGESESSEPIKYEALSYFWGQEDPSIPISIVTSNRNRLRQEKMWIRPNLRDALRQLRNEDENTVLWVDALCINQSDESEKTAQVSRMHEIYSKATSVCIWLGIGNKDPSNNQQMFEFLNDILNLRRLDQLVTSENHAAQWLSFVQLMRNRWFSRRWVVQELALAPEATIHYGAETMQWRDFKDAVALFVTKHDEIKKLLSKSRHSTDPDPVGDMRALGANTLVEATSNLFRRSDSGEILERLLSLELLVSTLLAFEATDPRDIIYGVLSIANDYDYSNPLVSVTTKTRSSEQASKNAGQHLITPDYLKPVADLFTDFVEYCVKTSGSLDIICRHWAPAAKYPNPPLPSWIPLIGGSAFGEPEAALQGRSNGDSLVGNPSRRHQKQYNASATLGPVAIFGRNFIEAEGPDISFPIRESGHMNSNAHSSSSVPPKQKVGEMRSNGKLFVKGMVIDSIDQLSPRAAQGMIFQESLEMGGWSNEIWNNSEDPIKIPDRLWRTLVADRGPDGTNAPSWYHRACLECLTQVTQNGDLATSTLIETPNSSTTMVSFLKRVQQVIWNRKFLRSQGGPGKEESKRLFGLAPTNARSSDLICILYGCSVPVILREIIRGSDHYYEFVGEAYVHGVMDGEAVLKSLLVYPYDDMNSVMFEIR